MFFFRRKGLRLFLSIRPGRGGGGSSTFSNNAATWARKQGIRVVESILDADVAIVIAHCGATPELLQQARAAGCFIIHRVDEHFGGFTEESYLKKHALIQSLNRWADVTVYQSEFVRRTAQPVLRAARHVMILNGGNTALFHPGPRPGTDIGHVTWGVIQKKRLDRVHEEILRRPAERFRLVGRHAHVDLPGVDFRLPNVLLRGERNRRRMPGEFRQMKVLYFPSENDPCPNTVVEAILCGVPVCYHPSGGTPDIVGDCGETLDQFDRLLANLETYRARCLRRQDLDFDHMMARYQDLWRERAGGSRPVREPSEP